ERGCFVKAVSNTSTLALRKSAAYNRHSLGVLEIVIPSAVYTAASCAAYAMTALPTSTPGDHPAITPLVPAYKSRAGADRPPADTTKPSPGFATTPVAPKATPVGAGGRCTRSGPDEGCEMPAPSYEVDVLLPRLVTTAGSCSGRATPHGSTRSGSVTRAVVP